MKQVERAIAETQTRNYPNLDELTWLSVIKLVGHFKVEKKRKQSR